MRYGNTNVGARRVGQFKQQVAKPAKLPPEANPWWWHPSRPGVPVGAPPSLARQIDEVDDEIELTLNRYTGRWQVWVKKPSMQTSVCWGWSLLFAVDYPNELVIARLYSASARKWGNGKAYFDAVMREQEREKESRERAHMNEVMASSMERFDYSQIKNIGSGSKFSTYHA